MCDETSSVEGPNWLKELEEKRERRLKARLGHEAGAGAPCITCKENCPGLDLHFWRKICKNCKCAKEDHDVPDDDLFGWAQFQLLGSKPNKSRKIKLPGKKDEVELEWTPKGHNETVDKYLQTLPPELLPVKGSTAAQERKQLLQKQIPIHDIDPTLCHDLTSTELEQMNEYIAHVKENSVGVGSLIQLGLNRSSVQHILGPTQSQIFTNRCPAQLSNVQTVQLQSSNSAKALPKQLSALSIEQKSQFDLNENLPSTLENYVQPIQGHLVDICDEQNTDRVDVLDNKRNLPHYLPTKLNTFVDTQKPQKIGNLLDLAFSTYDHSQQVDFDPNSNKNKPNQYQPSQLNLTESVQNPSQINIGVINDLTFPTVETKMAIQKPNEIFNQPSQKLQKNISINCHRCKKPFAEDAIVIGLDHSEALFHSSCFKCAGCNQNLADLLYFYDKENDDIYCGRDYAKIRGIPRCKACDELIFVKEYCLAENSTFHVKHFCCFECDMPLADQNYLVEDDQPLCIPCYNKNKAEICCACNFVIKPDEMGAKLNDLHFHATEFCFACKQCKKPLLESKFLLRNEKLFCSGTCYSTNLQ